MKKSILVIAVAAAFCSVANADLPPVAQFSVDGSATKLTTSYVNGKGVTVTNSYTQGSWFSMDADGSGDVQQGEVTQISGLNGLTVDGVTTQAADGTHNGQPGCTFDGGACSVGAIPDDPATTTIDESVPGVDFVEAPDIDNPWGFFNNTGMHQTTSPITIISDNGAGNVVLDFIGWDVTWNGISSIPMGGSVADGNNTATMTCYASGSYNASFPFELQTGAVTDCVDGAFYILDHAAPVPLGDPSGFGGVPYVIHLEGIITDTNLAPIATSNPLVEAVAPLGNVLIDLAGNVSDPDGHGIDNTSFSIIYTGSRSPVPTIVDDGAGNITYTDNAGSDTGAGTPDTFTYTVADVLGKVSATFSVEVGVVAGNIPPIAQSFSDDTNKEQAIVVDVIANVTDNDGTVDATTVEAANIVNGTVTNIDPVSGHVTFLPTGGFTGIASFDYRVQDDSGDFSNFATVTVNVNDPPVAVPDAANVPRNSTTGAIINVPANDTDSDGTIDKTTVVIVSGASNGTTSLDSATGIISYVPNTGYIGADLFTYTIKDDFGAVSNEAPVNISVNNALPVANNDTGAVDVTVAASVDINVVSNDTDSDGTIDVATVVIVSPPANGGVTDLGTGVVTYTPDASYLGTDQFSYTVNDNDGGPSNIALVDVNIVDPGASVLPVDAFLTISPAQITEIFTTPALGAGSYFSMEVEPGKRTHVALNGFDQLQLGVPQLGSVPFPGIDDPWSFFGNLGVHQTTSAVTIANDDGQGNVSLDMSGWDVSWNNIASIPLADGAHSGGINGVGVMSCAVDCVIGDTYVMDYFATVPLGDPSGFGGVKYSLHLEGTVSDGAPTLGGDMDLIMLPPTVIESAATDATGAVVTVVPGATAASAGNTSGVHLSATDIGSKDPLLNEADGQQCIGGCVDFTITGLTGAYVDVVVYLTEPIPSGAIYRKQINGIWGGFDLSQGDQVGSAAAIAGMCQEPAGTFETGLRTGNQCLYLRIFDGGPNDADGVVDGTVIDPSGVLLSGSPNTPSGFSDGCSISKTPVKLIERADWFIVFGFIAMMGLVSLKRRRQDQDS